MRQAPIGLGNDGGAQKDTPVKPARIWSLGPGLNQYPPIVTLRDVTCANGSRWRSRLQVKLSPPETVHPAKAERAPIGS